MTVAHVAAYMSHPGLLKWLGSYAGPGVLCERSREGACPLHFAALTGDGKTVECLCREAPRTLNLQTQAGATPIYFAAQEGHVMALRALVKAGASPKIATYDGVSPVHAATQGGHTEALHFLVSRHLGASDRSMLASLDLNLAWPPVRNLKGELEIRFYYLPEVFALFYVSNLNISGLHDFHKIRE